MGQMGTFWQQHPQAVKHHEEALPRGLQYLLQGYTTCSLPLVLVPSSTYRALGIPYRTPRTNYKTPITIYRTPAPQDLTSMTTSIRG